MIAYLTNLSKTNLSVQYNAALAITRAIGGSSREKLYQELGLASLKSRRWYRKLCLFFRLKKRINIALTSLIWFPKSYQHGLSKTITTFLHLMFNMNTSETLFFSCTVIEWNKLDNNIWNSESVSAFKKQILKFIRPSPNSTFNVHNPHGIKLLTRLRVGLSHLREHKFRHNFQDSLHPFCNCGRHIETTIHFFLHCSLFLIPCWTFIIKVTLCNLFLIMFFIFFIVYIIFIGKKR